MRSVERRRGRGGVSVRVLSAFIDPVQSVFEKGSIATGDKIKHGIRKISKAAHSVSGRIDGVR